MTMSPDEADRAGPAATADGTGVARAVALATMPVPPLAALLTGGPAVLSLVGATLFAIIGLLSSRLTPKARPMPLGVALVGQCIAFTAAFAGHPWQIDSHMLFFAMLAIVSTMGSIPALLLAVGMTALHHLVLGVVLPALVYPTVGLADVLFRTALHAAIVLFECIILVWSMARSATAAAETEAARANLAESVAQAADARTLAEAARERAMATTERTRQESQKAASAVEEIAATAKSAARGAAHARDVVAGAKGEAERSGQVVRRAVEAMAAIETSAVEIERIVDMIGEIARQTDLLALNAAVESARAGEAGAWLRGGGGRGPQAVPARGRGHSADPRPRRHLLVPGGRGRGARPRDRAGSRPDRRCGGRPE
ncbi:methyl-accepting chemotaxis protein McpB [Rubellimicrobium mesophilum DSM 19309]|uniref:Methyl-accepting chemotaxis protein McpB n=1 Tax=Rubellimicrobium mesophilum DSM 19309 TaxID=442562 RepID=A0A017HTT3_9RHOB|nr:methyl-accepting chemotaxis protein [Rubellimicrobium mesophilum]EYD77907.1 methyl-accepting chemotaxis protein McpB [Rubellimicrobium mesophilum DSM 19309]